MEKAYSELYVVLEAKKREKDLYQLAWQVDQARKGVQQILGLTKMEMC